MTILDTFYLLFQADSKGVATALDEVRGMGRKTAEDLQKVDAAVTDMGKSVGKGMEEAGAGAALADKEIRKAKEDLDKVTTAGREAGKAVDKGMDDAKNSARDANKEIERTRKTLKEVDDAAYKMGQSIGQSLRNLAMTAGAYLGVRELVSSFNEAVHAADKLDETAQRLDVPIETLSIWGDAAKEAGGSTQGLIGSIEAFNNSLAMMEVTGKSRAAPFLQELGIDLDNAANKGKTAFELLPQIAKAMEGMGKQQSGAIGRKLGLDAGTIMLLQMGGKEMDELLEKHKRLGFVTKEQGEIAAKWNDQLDDAKHALRSLWLEVASAVLPALTWLGKKFEEVFTFMRERGDFIVGLMIAIGSAIAVYAVPPLIAMGVAAITAMAPFLLIGAAVAALATVFALLYDDVMNFLAGNDSMLGELLKAFPEIQAGLQMIGDYYKWAGSVISDVAQIIGAVFAKVFAAIGNAFVEVITDFLSRFETVGTVAKGLGEVFKALGRLVGAMFTDWIDSIGRFLDKFGGVAGIVKGVGSAISGALGDAKTKLGIDVTPGLMEGKQQLSAASTSPIASMNSNAIRNSTMTNNKTTSIRTGDINVTTQATDAKGTGEAVAKALRDHFASANDDFNDGVVA